MFKRFSFFVFLVSTAQMVFAQLDSMKFVVPIRSEIQENQFCFSGLERVQSNALNSLFMIDLLLGQNPTQQALNAVKDRDFEISNTMESNQLDLRYYLKSKSKENFRIERSVYLNKYRTNLISISGDGANLILEGNGPSAGNDMDLTGSKVFSYSGVKSGVTWRKISVDSVFSFSYGLGVNLIDNFQKIEVVDGSLFTEANGSYIDFGILANSIRENSPAYFNMIGLTGDFSVAYRPKKNLTFKLGLNELGFGYSLQDLETRSYDTSGRWTGLTITDFSEKGLSDEIDSLEAFVNGEIVTQKGLIFLPQTLSLEVEYALSETQLIGLAAWARSFGRYGYGVNVNHKIAFNQNWALGSQLEIGNYSYFSINERLEFRKRNLNIFLGLYGINSLVSQINSTGAGLQIGLAYKL